MYRGIPVSGVRAAVGLRYGANHRSQWRAVHALRDPPPPKENPLAPLQFYFDFISPFGYFASLRIEALAARHGRTVEWHSMLLGVSVMKVMGLKPLMETPLKAPYIQREMQRYARKHGIAIGRAPGQAVMDPRAAGRAFHWVKHHHPTLAAPMAQAIYHAYWGQGVDLSTADAIAALPLPPGVDADTLRSAIDSDEARTLLREAVDASLKAGIFGSPTVVVDDEPFWGVQNFELVDEWLARGGW